MRLLVSVRSAAEARVAVTAGVDIVDAKEPNRGSLGAVSPVVLQQIAECIPGDQPLSIASGDRITPAEVLQSVSCVPRFRRAVTYLKLGFAGVSNPETVQQLLRVALDSDPGHTLGIVAVAYADPAHAGSLDPEVICRLAGEVGVTGVLLDTYQKGEGHLLTWLEPSRLSALLGDARREGLLTAVAGGLGIEHLSVLRQVGPDIVGFRGAACVGGREGELSADRVRLIRKQLNQSASGFIHPNRAWRDARETPGVSAILDHLR